MKVSQIVFSPTGGTEKIAEVLTEAWGLPVTKIDLSNAETDYSSIRLEKDDIAVIAVPSYGGRVPGLAAQRISGIHGDHTPCVIVCVYGNRAYEDTLVELNDVAEQSGFKVIAAIAAVAEHSIMHQYAAGRPDTEDKIELNSFAKKILEKKTVISPNFLHCKFRATVPIKKPAGLLWFPRQAMTVQTAGSARNSVRRRQSAKRTSKPQTAKSAFRVCGVLRNALTQPVK